MVRKAAIMLLLAVLLILHTSCWSSREVESLAFVMALGVDADENGVRLTVQVALPAGGAGGGGGQGAERPVWVTSFTAPSLTEGIFNMPALFGREPFLGHLQVVIMGQDFAKDGIHQLLDFLARERQVRDTIRLAVAVDKAEDILLVEPKVVQMPADYMVELLKQGERTGMIPPSEFLRTRQAWHNRPRLQIILPLLQPLEETEEESPAVAPEEKPPAEAEKKPEALLLKGSAVFRDDRLVGLLDTTESRGLAWLMGSVNNTIISIPREEGAITQHANFASVKFRMRKAANGARLTAVVSQDGNLTQWPLREQGITYPLLKQFERVLVQQIETEIRASLKAIQEVYQVDVIGIGEQLRRHAPEQFAALKWEEAFPHFVLALEVRASFRRIGLVFR